MIKNQYVFEEMLRKDDSVELYKVTCQSSVTEADARVKVTAVVAENIRKVTSGEPVTVGAKGIEWRVFTADREAVYHFAVESRDGRFPGIQLYRSPDEGQIYDNEKWLEADGQIFVRINNSSNDNAEYTFTATSKEIRDFENGESVTLDVDASEWRVFTADKEAMYNFSEGIDGEIVGIELYHSLDGEPEYGSAWLKAGERIYVRMVSWYNDEPVKCTFRVTSKEIKDVKNGDSVTPSEWCTFTADKEAIYHFEAKNDESSAEIELYNSPRGEPLESSVKWLKTGERIYVRISSDYDDTASYTFIADGKEITGITDGDSVTLAAYASEWRIFTADKEAMYYFAARNDVNSASIELYYSLDDEDPLANYKYFEEGERIYVKIYNRSNDTASYAFTAKEVVFTPITLGVRTEPLIFETYGEEKYLSVKVDQAGTYRISGQIDKETEESSDFWVQDMRTWEEENIYGTSNQTLKVDAGSDSTIYIRVYPYYAYEHEPDDSYGGSITLLVERQD